MSYLARGIAVLASMYSGTSEEAKSRLLSYTGVGILDSVGCPT